MENEDKSQSSVSRQDLLERLRNWRRRPHQMNHLVIDHIMRSKDGVLFDDLVSYAKSIGSKNPEGLVRSLLTNAGNNSGKILVQSGQQLIIDPDLLPEARDIWNQSSDPNKGYNGEEDITEGLLRLEQIRVSNFRNFREFKLELSPTFNLIIGRNGAGKTSILDAITLSISELLQGLKAGDPKQLKVEDIRLYKTFDSIERADAAQIETTASVGNRKLLWTISKRAKGRSSNGATTVELHDYAVDLNRSVKDEGRNYPVELPLIAFYSTARLWVSGRLNYHTSKKASASEKEGAVPSRYRGYKNSLQIGTNFREFLKWFRSKELAAIQKKGETFQLECVRRVIVQNIPACKNIYFELDPDVGESLMLEMEQGPPLPYSYLSDGYRNLLALFADLAWRCVTLNPQHGVDANLWTAGITMIDELDLHLHPAWQERIAQQLKDTFPRIQFIVTSHSPFIIQEMEDNEVIRIEQEEPQYLKGVNRMGLEDIAEDIQGVNTPQISRKREEMFDAAEEYYEILNSAAAHENPEEVAQLKDRLDAILEQYSDDPAYYAFLKQERIARGIF